MHKLKTLFAAACAFVACSAFAWTPGLEGGTVSAAPGSDAGKTSMPTTTSVYLHPEAASSTTSPGDTVYVYSGRIYLDGTYAFGSYFDDSVQLTIDGELVIAIYNNWSTYKTATITKSAGWYDIDVRVGNTSWDMGPCDGAKVKNPATEELESCGFGYKKLEAGETPPTANSGKSMNFYYRLVDDGTGSFLRCNKDGRGYEFAWGKLNRVDSTYVVDVKIDSDSVSSVDFTVQLTDSDGQTTESVLAKGVTSSDWVSYPLSGLEANKSYLVTLIASAGGVNYDEMSLGAICPSEISLSSIGSVDINTGDKATITVTRASDAVSTKYPLVVNLAFTGEAEKDVDFSAASSVTIPAGESSASTVISPLFNMEATADLSLIVSIASGGYLASSSSTTLSVLKPNGGWTLDTSAKTITECNASDTPWVFNVDISENNLTLKAPATVGTSTVLDFRKVIATTEGVQYQIVTSANSALAGKTTMTELYLPESMTTVSHDFCKNCTGLTKVQLGSKVQFIGNNAFYNCSSLTTVTPFLPDTLTSLGSHAFYRCLALTGDLVIGQSGSVTAGDSAAGMFTFSQITSMTIKNMATIPYAFAAALPALTSVSIDDATTTFAARVFYQCSVLTELTLPPNLTSMGAECFSYCPVLKRVTRVVEDGQPALTWSSNTFSTWNDYQCAFVIHRDQTTWNGAKLSDVMTPWKDLDAATQAKYTEAFPGEHEPRGVIIDSGNPRRQWVVVAKIEVTPGVKNLVINGEPEKFGASSVSPSYGIQKNISVPMDVSAPRYAPNEAGSTLYECTGYSLETSGDYEWGTPVTNLLSGTEATRTVNYTTDTDGDKRLSWLWTPAAYMVTIVQPTDPAIGSVEISQGSVEGYFKIGETATVTAVNGTGAFVKWHGDVPAGHETDNPLSLEIKGPTTLTPEFVMPWTWNASAGTITDGYWVLRATRSNDGKYTIYGMTTADPLGVLDLTKPVADGGAITKVEDWTFRLNTSIVELRLPETLSIIGKYAFASCHNLKKVTPFLPSGVTYIGEGAFWDSTALESELFLAKDGGDITFSSHSHFRETAIPKVTFGPDITAVGWASFLYCTKLAEVHLNEKITKIERDAFNGCTALETVEPFLPASVTKVDILAFCNCAKLKSPLVLETKKVQGVRPTIDLATSSESAHFWGCAMIPSITLGEVSTLRGRVFGSMTSVKDFYIKKKTPFEVSGSQNFKSWTARQSRWFIPKTGWESWLETNVTPWADVSDADKEAYSAAFPDGKKPYGMVKSGYQSLSGAQWAILWNPESSGFSLILR